MSRLREPARPDILSRLAAQFASAAQAGQALDALAADPERVSDWAGFDLLPGETKRITVSSADGSPLEDVSVVIHQLADVRE